MEGITEDKIKILAHEAIDKRIEEFRDQFCEPKYEQLRTERAERGKQIEKLDDAVGALAKCMNGKFNKLYYFLIALLASVITTLIAVLAK